MTHFGGGYDPDDDSDIIEGEAREVDADHEPRRFSWKKLLLLALALAGAILLVFAAFNSCGGGDSQSPGDTDSLTTVVPTEVVTTPEPTASVTVSTPTATSTSAVTVPTATVRADTGDPLGLTDGSSGSGVVMFVLALLVATSCVWIFFRKTGPERHR